jgi:hypothetical protein
MLSCVALICDGRLDGASASEVPSLPGMWWGLAGTTDAGWRGVSCDAEREVMNMG